MEEVKNMEETKPMTQEERQQAILEDCVEIARAFHTMAQHMEVPESVMLGAFALAFTSGVHAINKGFADAVAEGKFPIEEIEADLAEMNTAIAKVLEHNQRIITEKPYFLGKPGFTINFGIKPL